MSSLISFSWVSNEKKAPRCLGYMGCFQRVHGEIDPLKKEVPIGALIFRVQSSPSEFSGKFSSVNH